MILKTFMTFMTFPGLGAGWGVERR